MADIKKMPVMEFVELGVLQELNRKFLHPLGLALAVQVDKENGTATLDGIWDAREDPEGWIFVDDVLSTPDAAKKADNVARMVEKHYGARCKLFRLGNIQPVAFPPDTDPTAEP